jgi:molecular chaperone Hsp33
MMTDHDSFRRFVFEGIGVRGELVHLDSSWQAVLERHPYPPSVRDQLGQALAAVVLLSATIKFKGSLILQAQSEGPLHTLVAQATDARTIRGLAQWNGMPPEGTALHEIFGQGRLALTIQNEGAEPYQGIVGLEGATLADAIESYFTQSEQLATRLWLAADGDSAVGLFVQELPAEHGDREDWNRITTLADTVTEVELLRLPSEELLYRLFNEEEIRVFPPETVSFRCGCSRERIAAMLRSLGKSEIDSVVEEVGAVEVGCEFCNRRYVFDRVDAETLFAEQFLPASKTRH